MSTTHAASLPMQIDVSTLLTDLAKIAGGYEYSGACSLQVCFPLKAGGELRFGIYDAEDGGVEFGIDLYDGALPPGISGPANLTGSKA